MSWLGVAVVVLVLVVVIGVGAAVAFGAIVRAGQAEPDPTIEFGDGGF